MKVILLVAISLIALISLWLATSNRQPGVTNDTPALPLTDKAMTTVPVSKPLGQKFLAPIDRAAERITKKPFGIKITPQDSPVQPEKFSGYHTGVDYETFDSEKNAAIPIKAICDGNVIFKQRVNGYGGVLVQSCQYNDRPITVLYGHLTLATIGLKVGNQIRAGTVVGNLGQGYSSDTDGERKHLHLGIHLGDKVELRGYVRTVGELSDWLDGQKLLGAG